MKKERTAMYSEFIIQSNGTIKENIGFVANPNSTFDPDEITKMLNIIPNNTMKLGEERKKGKGLYPFSTWSGCRKDTPRLEVEKQIMSSINQLKDKISILKEIKKKYDVNFYMKSVPSIFNEEAPYVHYNQKIIDFCYQTGTELGVHLYVFDTPKEESR